MYWHNVHIVRDTGCLNSNKSVDIKYIQYKTVHV